MNWLGWAVTIIIAGGIIVCWLGYKIGKFSYDCDQDMKRITHEKGIADSRPYHSRLRHKSSK